MHYGSYIPFTSAPAEKKRPSPVNTVKTVSGCSSSVLSASMMSRIKLPPKELRDFGRLNYCSQDEPKFILGKNDYLL